MIPFYEQDLYSEMKTLITASSYKITRVMGGRSNVFLLSANDQILLVDTGAQFMRKLLLKRLVKLGIERIDYLILTHTHCDHAGNSMIIREKYNAKVVVHKDEAGYLESGNNIIPEGTNPFTKILMKIVSGLFAQAAKYKPCTCDICVDTSYDFSDKGINAYVLHTPGHTPGSMSLIIDNQIALVGDTMFGIYWRTVFPPFANDVNSLMKSWSDLLKTQCIWFLPSHGSANSRQLVENDYRRKNKSDIAY